MLTGSEESCREALICDAIKYCVTRNPTRFNNIHYINLAQANDLAEQIALIRNKLGFSNSDQTGFSGRDGSDS